MRIKGAILLLLFVSCLMMPSAFGHGMSEADQARAATGGFMDFFPLGAMHMLTGYDHLLFLFGVIFFLTRFTDILKFVTAFTLGHSITLIVGTFFAIRANCFLVDAVIALTVCYKGFDNLDGFKKYLNMNAPKLLPVVFLFGLIHGFGLSTRLQQLTIGSGMDLLMKIIAFNVGVEAGQIGALAIILAALSMWRKTGSFVRFSAASNVGLVVVGGLLFIMQLHGYSHETAPTSFPLNLDAHFHAHKNTVAAATKPELPEGYHVDEPGEAPHADHDHDAAVPEGFHVDQPGEAPHADHDHDAAAPEGLHIDEPGQAPHADHDHDTAVPEGFHVDEPGQAPHADHDHHSAAPNGFHVGEPVFSNA